MTMPTLKDAFENAVRQGVVMSLGPGGQVTMFGPRPASLALNAAIKGNEDLFVTLLCEHLGRSGRQSFVQESDLDSTSRPTREEKQDAWRAAGNYLQHLARHPA